LVLTPVLLRDVGFTRVVEVAATVGAGVMLAPEMVLLTVGAGVVTLRIVEVVVVVVVVGVSVGLMVGLTVGLMVGLMVGLSVGAVVVAAFRRTVDAFAALGACALPKGSSRRATDTSTHSDEAVRRRIFTGLPQSEETAVWVTQIISRSSGIQGEGISHACERAHSLSRPVRH
jgi:thiamine transporter ThiT